MNSGAVSYHGGHSGQYCSHAQDRLEDIILQYIHLGFKAVGITEHIPPSDDRFVYPDEQSLGLTAETLYQRFASYFKELKALKKKYADQITIYAGMETETVTGYISHVNDLIQTFKPDYIVGSVHHVDDVCFDYSKSEYNRLVAKLGSKQDVYARYFDLQYEMIQSITPFVVGHFDLIRIYDDDYQKTLLLPEIEDRIERNLTLIQSSGLVMDFNLRPLTKGKTEPYISAPILEKAKKMGISLVPGDDSHSLKEVGLHVNTAMDILSDYGFDLNWPAPRLLQ
jgi:histidinol-phosphatase (PHP family)